MPTNQIKPFATGSGANVLTPDIYDVLAARLTGFVAGVAQSQQLNTVWRQSSFVSAMVAQFIADNANVDVLDDGDIAGLEAKLVTALNEVSLSNERATELGIGADLATTNLLSGINLDVVTDPGEHYYDETCSGFPTGMTFGLIKIWRENTGFIYQIVQGSHNTGFAWRFYTHVTPGWMPWQIAANTTYVDNSISEATHAAQGGSDRAVASGGFNTTETVVFNPTLATLPADGFLMVTSSLNGGPGNYNFRLKTAITGTGKMTDQTMEDGQAVSMSHSMCVAVAAGATPTITISAWSDTVSQAGTVQFSYLYVPSA